MSKVNLKDNIWIEGFDDMKSQLFKFNYLMNDIDISHSLGNCSSYSSIQCFKTSEISEELAKTICYKKQFYLNYALFNDLKENDWREPYMFTSAKESIQSACSKEYCIIYKNL